MCISRVLVCVYLECSCSSELSRVAHLVWSNGEAPGGRMTDIIPCVGQQYIVHLVDP